MSDLEATVARLRALPAATQNDILPQLDQILGDTAQSLLTPEQLFLLGYRPSEDDSITPHDSVTNDGTTPIFWSQSAILDLHAVGVVNNEHSTTEPHMQDRILAAIGLLKKFPEMAPAMDNGMRQFLVLRTRYIVIYRFLDGRVEIWGVFVLNP